MAFPDEDLAQYKRIAESAHAKLTSIPNAELLAFIARLEAAEKLASAAESLARLLPRPGSHREQLLCHYDPEVIDILSAISSWHKAAGK